MLQGKKKLSKTKEEEGVALRCKKNKRRKQKNIRGAVP
jgi:hypothetical protein